VIVLDSGVLYASFDRSDRWHERSVALVRENRGKLILPAPVIPEVDYLLGRRLGAAARLALYAGINGSHYFVVDLPRDSYRRVDELNRQYPDLDLGFVDAAVVAITGSLGLKTIATTDRQHFAPLATQLGLTLVPE
jgi:uncharacterized protein